MRVRPPIPLVCFALCALACAGADVAATGGSAVPPRSAEARPLRPTQGSAARDAQDATARPAQDTTARDAQDTTARPAQDTTARDAQDTTARDAQDTTARDAQDTTARDAQDTTARPAQAALHVTSVGSPTRIWPGPSTRGTFLGTLRVGDSLPVRAAEPTPGERCPGGFVPVEPRGWVCLDRTATLSPDPRSIEAARYTRAVPGPFPYGYAISNGAPMYLRMPTRDEQARIERKFGPAGTRQALPRALAAHEDLAVDEAIPARDPVPSFLKRERDAPGRLLRDDIPFGSMLSFARAFAAGGRTWLLTPDLTLVPADRVRPFRPSRFQGTRLDGNVALPIAWIRASPKPRYRLDASGAVQVAGGEIPARTFVRLTGRRVKHAGATYLETRDQLSGGGTLVVAESDATVVEPAAALPFGVASGQKWILVRITKGTLVAYEGLTPVYATLISPGKGGVSLPGRDPVEHATTPRGTFYVTYKDRAATMSPDRGDERLSWIADVPHTQYFNPPFALHAAYWHERFGEPTSAGCVNVSPIDAEALFDWSDPPVPDGWQGATGAGAPENGSTTAIVVRR